MLKPTILVLLLGLLPASQSLAMNARDIMQKNIDRDDGHSQYSTSVVATCRYASKNGKVRCVEKPRIKLLEGAQKDYGKNNKDSRSVSIILKPVAESGIGFLQFDYHDAERDSDQWMYLSALGKVKRLVSGNNDEPKTGTLFGSEIAYEDIEKTHIDDYNYKLLKEETLQGRDCWVIESIPKPARARKSNYSRSISWIDKEHYLFLQAHIYDRTGRPIKQIISSQHEQVNGIWISKQLNVNNVQSQRITTMKTQQIVINPEVQDELFSQRTLTDGAYRAKQLKLLRQAL